MTWRRLSRAAVVLGGLALVWTLVVLWTGGAVFYIGGVRISSRGPRNPAILTLLSLVIAWVLAPAGQRGRFLAGECRRLLDLITRWLSWIPATPRTARMIAALAAVWIVVVGFAEGAFVVGGSDSYGYVSQAHLWMIGALRQEPPLLRSVPDDITIEALSPLGYRPAFDRMTIAPTYSPGLPMVMAVFERIAGRDSVFWVVPLLGGLLVWTTYLLGLRVGGPLLGAIAATLTATSPPVLFQLTAAPMSDLPAAAWWALALLLVTIDRRDAALGAGVATGLAILTRPNLVPVAVVVGGVLLWRFAAARESRGRTFQQLLLFGVPALAGCLTIAEVNRALWGSMLTSGYGSLVDQPPFSMKALWPNLLIYPRALVTQLPIVLVFVVALWQRQLRGDATPPVHKDRPYVVALWSCVAVVMALYVAYPAFDSEWNLRFLLPLVSPLLVLAGATALSLTRRLIERERAAFVVAMLIICGYGVDHARNVGAFELAHLRRFAQIGPHITRELPERTVLLSMLHSGSATYYTGRPTLRWDLIPPSRLDSLIDDLKQRGFEPYLLLDGDERAQFVSRYRGHSRLGALDWPPLVTVRPAEAHIYAIPPRP